MRNRVKIKNYVVADILHHCQQDQKNRVSQG
jgi:hypothetical protein